MKQQTKTAIMITTCTLLSFLAAYFIAIESGKVNPLVNAFIIYRTFLLLGLAAGFGAVALSLIIAPIKQFNK
jgi:hypothetical protein